MIHALAPHQHIAFVDDRTIALDLAADRYRLFGPRETRTLRALSAGEETDDPAALSTLHDQGLLAFAGRPIAVVDHRRPARSARELDFAGVGSVSFGHVLAAYARASLGLHFRGLRACLEAAARRNAAIEADTLVMTEPRNARLVGVAQSYARQRRRLPIAPNCLRDTLALHRLLAAAGYRTTLVIAVRLAPFAAHCWLQEGDMLLNDSCDFVSGFMPILVL